MTRLDLRSESGFTLIELLVATVIGIIVSTATMAIVIVSVHFSSNYADRVDANQQGTIAIQKITQQLNSSCVASSVAPILSTSDANDVWFYSLLGDSPTIQPNEVEISYTGGSLVMNTYTYVSGTAPSSWTFSSTPTKLVLVAERGAGRLDADLPVLRLRLKRRAVDHALHAEHDARHHQRCDDGGRGDHLPGESVR